VRPHGLRHSGITAGLDVSHGNVRFARQYSRHRSIEVLLKYDDNREDVAGDITRKVVERVAGARPAGSAATCAVGGTGTGKNHIALNRASGADPSVTTGAPPTITIVETAEAAAEMTAMESMTSAPVVATKAVTTTAHSATAHATAAVTAATATPTHQDQRTTRCTQLLGVAGIARQRGQ